MESLYIAHLHKMNHKKDDVLIILQCKTPNNTTQVHLGKTIHIQILVLFFISFLKMVVFLDCHFVQGIKSAFLSPQIDSGNPGRQVSVTIPKHQGNTVKSVLRAQLKRASQNPVPLFFLCTLLVLFSCTIQILNKRLVIKLCVHLSRVFIAISLSFWVPLSLILLQLKTDLISKTFFVIVVVLF